MYLAFKRLLDVTVSVIGMLFVSPVFLLIAVAIKLESPGPVFFVQKAVGRGGREFRLLKFRSMVPGSQDDLHKSDLQRNYRIATATSCDSKGRPVFKMALADRSRITRVGRILRRTSLDELPQLWNVLVGDMSLVGPRPALPWEVELYDERERRRLSIRPGLTGLYQVTARNHVDVREMIRIDLEYVRKRSAWLDLELLIRTPRAMFNGM